MLRWRTRRRIGVGLWSHAFKEKLFCHVALKGVEAAVYYRLTLLTSEGEIVPERVAAFSILNSRFGSDEMDLAR